MKVYAGIGSRKLAKEEIGLCYALGALLATKGYTLRTGAAQGADKAFAEGSLSVGGRVILCLPWDSYERGWVQWAKEHGAVVRVLQDTDERAFLSVDKYHPAPHRLSSGAKALHARNWLIVAGVDFVVAWPKPNQYGALGGTGQGIKIAQSKNIHVTNMNDPKQFNRILEKMKGI